MTPLLQARGLNFAYGAKAVLHDLSLELAAGQVVTLIGPNGSGKSTLIKCLCGLLHASGEIRIRDIPLARWRRRMLARTIAYLPQNPSYEPGDLVLDVLRLGRACYWTAFGLESEHDLKTVSAIADLLELTDLLSRRMDELSGGQRQRVFIGRCLVQEPALLVLDEPNTYLDLKHQVDLLKLLQQLAHERQLSILMASHDLNLAGAFADGMLLMCDGRLIARGTPQEVLQAPTISQAYGLAMQQLPHETLRILVPTI